MNRSTSYYRSAFIATVLVCSIVPQAVFASTSAYWRHEEGATGQHVPDGDNTVLDSSGNDNHMQTFSSANAPFTAATYSTNVSPLALRSGMTNSLSLDFGPNPGSGTDDGGERNDDNYTAGKSIQTELFTAMTVELAFNMNTVDGSFQTLFGRDGKPLGDDEGEPDEPIAPLQIKVRGDDVPNGIANQLFIEWIDGDGDIHSLASGKSVVAGEWNHVAFTLTATSAELWIAGETGDYLLEDAISGEDFAGPLGPGEVTIFETLGFSEGRGFYDNNVTDWSDAIIDEIRISNTALLSNEFLFLTVPDSALVGDYNDDGTVDAADYTVWRDNTGTSFALPNRDPGLSGDVGTADYNAWVASYGSTNLSNSSTTSVPEPTSLMLTFGALLTLGASNRRNNAGWST